MIQNLTPKVGRNKRKIFMPKENKENVNTILEHNLDTTLSTKIHNPLLTTHPRAIGTLSPLNNSMYDVALLVRR